MAFFEFFKRLRGSALSGRLDAEMEEEMRFHLERQIEKNLRLGMSPEAARRNALIKFGGVERMKDNAREEARPMVIEDVTRDLRFGLRALRRSPGFAAVAILTLGLGIGAATAVFSVVRGVLLKPLPYADADQLVRVYQLDKDANQANMSHANYVDVKAQARGFESMATMRQAGPTAIVGAGDAHHALLVAVSRDFLDVMKVRPIHGRSFAKDEQQVGGTPAALVSHSYWQERLSSRLDFNRVSLTVGDRAYQVVGVLPPQFSYPNGAQIWVPEELDEPRGERTALNYQVIGRIKPGMTLTDASSDLSGLARRLKTQYGEATWMVDATAVPLLQQMTATAKPVLLTLLGAAFMLLLIACANVSNLLLARSATRTRELAVRLAMGASRWRVARQLLAESFVLSAAAGLVGVLTAIWGVRALLQLEPGNLPRVDNVGVDVGVLLFAIGVSVLMAALLSLITTVRVSADDLRAAMTEGRTISASRASQHIRDGLVIAQVAFTLMLLIGAGLLGRSFGQLLAVNNGYDTQNALLLDLRMPWAETEEASARQIDFQNRLMERIRAMPGISGVGLINDFPLGGGNYSNGQFLEMNSPTEITTFEQYMALSPAQKEARAGNAGFRVANAEYFRVMRIPLIRGRLFDAGDARSQPHVALVSEALAKQKWPNADPIGKFIQFGNMDGDLRAFRIVGIVGDVRENSPENPGGPLFYGNYAQRPSAAAQFSLVVRGPRAIESGAAAQQLVRELNPNLPVGVRTMEQAFDRTLAGRRFSLMLIGVFGVAALVLATLGIYGVISYLVAQRTREIGIRMALGADSGMLLRMVLGRGARLALVGVVVGILGSLAMTRVLSGMLYGVKVTDPLAFLGVISVISASVFVATYIPARRALRVPPIITLRSE